MKLLLDEFANRPDGGFDGGAGGRAEPRIR
jgi:hypothetical protein